ncbi:lipid storage droplets surface-binding protein 1 [Pogonomyrmex barbatus]|uniref:Lipid storage droplets surface-binding protein 1 n=1 Tax=Pogonomyrmex barbatus TaxID=144034 RepID=A0A8N1S8W7_9HYME|nr:lipid storage droplets surface-binding protein 1 [Pogonomyrmex barbatus]
MRYRRRFAVFDVQSTVRSSDETPSFLPSQPTAGFERDWPRYTAFIKNQQVAFRRISLPLFSATTLHMARANVKRRHSDLPHFESVARISSLPIVESGIHIAGNVYRKIKRSNSLMNWSLDTAEQSLAIATATARPAIFALNGPITTIDQLLCKGIDIVEQRVPAVHLPPHVIYLNTREYVNKKIVKPVLMRAGSVKQIGSQAANAAADRLDGALTVADKYVDRYLPGDPTDKEEANPVESVSKTTRTIKHGARFSRKLQKRLTRRTLVEARALKQQGTECIHVLLYIVELVSQYSISLLYFNWLYIVYIIFQLTLLIGKNNVIKEQISVIRSGIERLSSTTNQILEKFAAFLAGRPSHQKVPHMRNREQNHNNHMSATSNPPINGIE